MLLQAATPPSPGTYIEILRAAHVVVARVVWAGDRRFGIQSQDRMNVPALIAAMAPGAPRLPGQERRTRDRTPARVATAADIARAAERSRRFARAFQFGLFLVGGVLSAGLLGSLAYEVLASPFKTISTHLVPE